MATRSEWVIDKTEAVAHDGMVAAMQPQAAEAGAEILRRGGNAIDAAVATAFAVGVVEPFMSGVGGIAFMVYRDAASGHTVCFDGSTMLPAAIRPEMFELLPGDQRAGMYGWRATKNDAGNTGWLSPGVPGMPDLMGQAHRRFGRLPWADLLAPAIRLAEDGFEVNPYVAVTIASSYELLARVAETKRTFIRANGAPPASGARFQQPDLARTLRLIAAEGPETVYRGAVGRLIAEDMARNGGLITEADLADQRTIILENANEIAYRSYRILGQVENSGFATVAEALAILDGFDLARLGFHSTEALHLEIEALRRAFVDRLRYLGDASLMPVPYAGAVSPGYAAERRATIDMARATPAAGPGDPWRFEPSRPELAATRSGNTEDGQTSHISVIDRERNMVSLTSTLGGGFGSGVVIKGTGITLNNATTWFDPEPGAVASIGPGKRVMSAASPVLVLRDGKPLMALGSPGGRRVISAVYQCLINVLDFGLGMQAAISAPRMHCEGRATELSQRLPSAAIDGLTRLGHEVKLQEDALFGGHFARPNGILVDDSGALHGGVFQYTPATAIGV